MPYTLRIGAGRLAPIHEHRDTATICSFYNTELIADTQPTVIGEGLLIDLACYLFGLAPDYTLIVFMALAGVMTQVIHKHSHLRGHTKAQVDLAAKIIFKLQDWHVLMSHETHRTHHQNGTNTCLTNGWCNALLNLIVPRDDEYEVVPKARLDQPVYDIPEVEQMRKDRLDQMFGKGAVGRE